MTNKIPIPALPPTPAGRVRIPDAARQLGISTRQLVDLVDRSELRAARGPGEMPTIAQADLVAYLARRGQPS